MLQPRVQPSLLSLGLRFGLQIFPATSEISTKQIFLVPPGFYGCPVDNKCNFGSGLLGRAGVGTHSRLWQGMSLVLPGIIPVGSWILQRDLGWFSWKMRDFGFGERDFVQLESCTEQTRGRWGNHHPEFPENPIPTSLKTPPKLPENPIPISLGPCANLPEIPIPNCLKTPSRSP